MNSVLVSVEDDVELSLYTLLTGASAISDKCLFKLGIEGSLFSIDCSVKSSFSYWLSGGS